MSITSDSNKKGHKLYKLGLRMAFYSALISSVLLAAGFYFFTDLAPAQIFLTSGMAFTAVILATYFVSRSLQYNRLETLEHISKNIAVKRFKEYADVTTPYNDEVDYLIKKSITSSRRIEREIQRLNRIENYRKEFIGDISHELKTPIFAIQGFIETLLNGAIDDEEVNREFLKKAMRNVNRLIYLTKDLMEISKLETGELKSDIEEVNFHEVLNDIIESLNYKAQKENIKLKLHDINKHTMVKADKNQLKQVLINLIENGIKYNVPGGEVEVGMKTVPRKRDKVFVYVKDTGIGIDEKDIPRVTERFFRVDKSRSREKGGTGLGLAIVKHIMEAHGESFKIESKPNEGTTFTISLSRTHAFAE